MASINELVTQLQIQPCVRRRFEADIAAIQKAIDTAVLEEPSAREALHAQWTNARAAVRASEVAASDNDPRGAAIQQGTRLAVRGSGPASGRRKAGRI